MYRITDGTRTIEIALYEGELDITVDYLDLHAYAGLTPLEDGTHVVDDVDWIIMRAEDWRDESDDNNLYWHDVELVALPEDYLL